MKYLLALLFSFTIILSCEKDQNLISNGDQAIEVRAPGAKVTICHHNKTKQVNSNALAGHLAHGDYLGPCVEINCDPLCSLCEYLDFLDFDEPCETNAFASGDYYCSRDFTNNCADNPSFETKGESTIWDNDYFRNMSCNGDDSENDEGFLFAVYERACDGTPFGQVQFYYHNYDTGEIIDEITFAATEEAYNQAVFCRTVIDGLAAQLGMTDNCEE